ncbi:hypothetical protein GWK47_039566 [Chionoecetes opilio]|uniref:Uncharacterized protein n=1 Tax=Chionoecetes opilio TaxID=41210 RepID=A0A8J4YLA6_CHIOP|nr:hypothetical protein GWK47_039566 [Chionoecetes opilio]
MNAVLKRLLEWKEVPADTAVLSFFYLQHFYLNEILRGTCHTGNYKVRSEFRTCIQKAADIIFPDDICAPESLVDRIRDNQLKMQIHTKTPAETAPKTSADIAPKTGPETFADTDPETSADRAPRLPPTELPRLPPTQFPRLPPTQIPRLPPTQLQRLYFQRRRQRLHRQSSTTTAYNSCYHIMAAKKSVGIDIVPSKKNISLSQLAKNSRKKCDKKSGRKKPRKRDLEVDPAPDSAAAAKRHCSDFIQDINEDFNHLHHGTDELTQSTDIPTPTDKIQDPNPYPIDIEPLNDDNWLNQYCDFTEHGYFTIRRTDKFWSGNFSDQTIELELMRLLKTYGGIARGRGITDSTLNKWVHAMPRCIPICDALECFTAVHSHTSDQHVDLRASSTARDAKDYETFLNWLKVHSIFIWRP